MQLIVTYATGTY